jgi:hypothetical protein
MLSREAFDQLAELVPAEVIEARRRGVALRDPAGITAQLRPR